MEAYERIQPGLAERIMSMAEKEQTHRHAMEHIVIPEQIKQARQGQLHSTGIVIIAILAVVPIGIWGNPVAAGILGAGGFLPWVINLFFGKKSPTPPEREKK